MLGGSACRVDCERRLRYTVMVRVVEEIHSVAWTHLEVSSHKYSTLQLCLLQLSSPQVLPHRVSMVQRPQGAHKRPTSSSMRCCWFVSSIIQSLHTCASPHTLPDQSTAPILDPAKLPLRHQCSTSWASICCGMAADSPRKNAERVTMLRLLPWQLTALKSADEPEWANQVTRYACFRISCTHPRCDQAPFCGISEEMEVRMEKHVNSFNPTCMVPTSVAEEQLGSEVKATHPAFLLSSSALLGCEAYTFDGGYIAWVMDDKVTPDRD